MMNPLASARRTRVVATSIRTILTALPVLLASILCVLPARGRERETPAANATEVLNPVYGSAWKTQTQPDLAAFNRWTRDFLADQTARDSAAAGIPSPSEKVAPGVALAVRRRVALAELLRRDPLQALAAAVPEAIRARLPAQIQAELEKPFSTTGEFRLKAELRALGGPVVTPERREVVLDGRTYAAHVYGRRLDLTSKRGIFLHGFLLGSDAVLDENVLRVLSPGELALRESVDGAPQILSTPTADSKSVEVEAGGRLYRFGAVAQVQETEAALRTLEKHRSAESISLNEQTAVEHPERIPVVPESAYTTGAKQVLIIRVDFSDLPGDPTFYSTTDTAAAVQNIADTQVAPYYTRASYSQTGLVNTVTTQLYRMPRTANDYATSGDNDGLHADAETAAAANYTLADYDRIGVVFTYLGNISGSQITYGGLSVVGGPELWVNGEFDFRVVAHELGHTYGLIHANLWLVTDGNPISPNGSTEEYGDDYDVMGANYANSQDCEFNVWYKNQLGWVPDSQIELINQSGTYRVSQFDGGSNSGTYLALEIPKDTTRNYWVSIRRNFTSNSSMSHGTYTTWGYNNNYTQHNLLDMETPGNSDSDAALPTGTNFTDSTSGVSITPTTEGGTAPNAYEDVQIALTPAAQAPQIESTSSATTSAGEAFSYQIIATNDPTSYSASGLPAGLSVSTSTGLISGKATTFGNSQVTIGAANSSGSATATITVSVGGANDDFAQAQKLSGASSSVSGSNVNASKEAGEPNHAGQAGGASVWYSWTPASNGAASFTTTTSSFDTLLAVYTGSSVSSLTQVAAAAASSTSNSVSFAATAGTTYRIAVDGDYGETGQFTLAWSETATPGALAFAASSYAVNEDAGTVGVQVARTAGSTGAVTVNCTTSSGTAKSGTDYTGINTTLSWADGDTASKTVTVAIKDLGISDGSARSFSLKLANPTGNAALGSPATATVTINENDSGTTLAFAAGTYSVDENAGSVAVSVARGGSGTGAASVTCATSSGTAKSGTDYTGKSQTLSWAAGDSAAKTFTVSLKDLGLTDGSTRQFVIKLSTPSGASLGSPSTATVTIHENDPVGGELRFVSSAYSVDETAGTVTVHVERLDGTTGAVSVTCATSAGTAKSGTDYTGKSQTLSWAAGDKSLKSFVVTIKDRGASGGGGLKFSVLLSSPTGGAGLVSPASATVTIN